MYAGPTQPPARAPRAPGASPDPVAAKRGAFNLAAAEAAEDEREREVLEQMLQAQLKFEDEILKKWIEMI